MKFWICTVFLLIAACFPIPSSAQTATQANYVWRSVKVGGGGFIPGIVFSRVEKGLAYLRSDMGGCYRWEDQAKTWIPMQDAMGESSYFGGESIAPDPVDANVVYIAAGMYRGDPSAILRSRDKGKTWETFPVTFRMGGNEDGRGLGERLAIDPNQTSTLYFGSRYNGLWRSEDSAQTWKQVESFPLNGLGLPTQNGPGHAGLSFVVFNPKSGTRGSATQTIFVGNADPGKEHLYRSDDAGKTWSAVPGGPQESFLPAQAQIDDEGTTLHITYGKGIGPNGVTDGAVMMLDVKSNQWTDITPDKSPNRGPGGYCGLSLDRQHPGTLGVTSMNRWSPVDTVWRSTDNGKTWSDIVEKSERDVHASPFLLWGKDKAKLGWWMAAFAIDPFDSDHACYSTGATIYATNDFSNVNKNEPTHWYPWVEGIEQTAIITLLSPSEGPHLISGFGDIGGFTHDDLSVSPPEMFENPQFNTTNNIECAGKAPNVIVRSGRPNDGQASLGYSEDGGHTWQPLKLSNTAAQGRSVPAIIVSADGRTFMVMTRTPVITTDRGKTWEKVKGLPEGTRAIADPVDPEIFYALNFKTGELLTSNDGGANFTASPTKGLPADIKSDAPTSAEAAWPFQATPGKQGDLWLVSHAGLFHSGDSGKTFEATADKLKVEMLSFGKAAPGKDYPSLFAVGKMNELKAIWRSDDAGQSWIRVNDDQHQYGTRFRCIAGDPRIFGRVYVGTDGRGVLYGEPANAPG